MKTAVTMPDEIDTINERIEAGDDESDARPLTVFAAAGPYTTEDRLDFSPFHALLDAAKDAQVDALILCGPFLDVEHPKIRDGDIEFPSDYKLQPDEVTLNDVFKCFISRPLEGLAKALPSISIIMCPSIRDVLSKHAAWPQDKIIKKGLELPKQVTIVTNPMTIGLNESVFGITSLDVLDQLRGSSVTGGRALQEDFLQRLCQQLIEQRHYFPVMPAAARQRSGTLPAVDEDAGLQFDALGASLDVSYLKLGEMYEIVPDILVVPSVLKPFAKVSTLFDPDGRIKLTIMWFRL
jgi:DNA polymerase alpha subunit B